MKITHIMINNFRGVKNLEVNVDRDNCMLVGFNGVGKTTVHQAIQCVLFGYCHDNQGARIKNERLVGPHSRAADIAIAMDIHDENFVAQLHITKSKGMELTLMKGDTVVTTIQKDARERLFSEAAIDPMHCLCGANPKAFLASKDMVDLIAELDGGTVSLETVKPHLGENADWFEKWLKDTQLPLTSMKDITEVGKAMAKAQTAVNKQIGGYERLIDAADSVEVPLNKEGAELTVDQIPVVEKNIRQMTTERNNLLEMRGKASQVNPQTLLADIKKAKEQLDKTEALSDGLNKRLEKAEDALSKEKTTVQSLQAEYSAMTSYNSEREAEVCTLKDSIAGFDDGVCHVCKSTLSEQQIETLTGAVKEKITDIEAGLHTKDAITKLKRKLTAAEKKLDKAEAQVQDAEEAVAEHRITVASQVRYVSNCEEQYEAFESVGMPVEEINKRLEHIEDRLDMAENALSALKRLAEVQTAEEMLKSRQEELAKVKWGLQMFRDGELKEALGTGGRELLTSKCNAILNPFGFEFKIEGSQPMMGEKGQPMVGMAELSGGEFLIAQLAVAVAFAQNGIVCLDEVERLQAKYKSIFFQIVAEHKLAGLWFTATHTQAAAFQLEAMLAALPSVNVVWVGPKE